MGRGKAFDRRRRKRTRVVKPIKGVVGGLIEYGVSTDEVSGASISQRVVYNANAGECWWSAEGLFGSKLTKLDASGNATGAPGLTVRFATRPKSVELFDCTGRKVDCPVRIAHAGIADVPVPASGLLVTRR